jgi:hypothetical protein
MTEDGEKNPVVDDNIPRDLSDVSDDLFDVEISLVPCE